MAGQLQVPDDGSTHVIPSLHFVGHVALRRERSRLVEHGITDDRVFDGSARYRFVSASIVRVPRFSHLASCCPTRSLILQLSSKVSRQSVSWRMHNVRKATRGCYSIVQLACVVLQMRVKKLRWFFKSSIAQNPGAASVRCDINSK